MAITWRDVGGSNVVNPQNTPTSKGGVGGFLSTLGQSLSTIDTTRQSIGEDQLQRQLQGASSQAEVDAIQRDPTSFFSTSQDTFDSQKLDRGEVLGERKSNANVKSLNDAVSNLAKQRSTRRGVNTNLQDAFVDSTSGVQFNDSGSLVFDSDVGEDEQGFLRSQWEEQASKAPELLTDKQRTQYIDDLTTKLGATAAQSNAAKKSLNELTTESEQLTDRQTGYVNSQMASFDTRAEQAKVQMEDEYNATLAKSPVNFELTLEQEKLKPGTAISEIVATVPETSIYFADRKGGSDLTKMLGDVISGGYEYVDPNTGNKKTREYPGWVLKEAMNRTTKYGTDDAWFSLDRGVLEKEFQDKLDEVTNLHEADLRSVDIRNKAKKDRDAGIAKLNLQRLSAKSIATRQARSK